MSAEDDADLRRGARGGLCGTCSWARLGRSGRGSVFVRCTHPELPKYLMQPVLRCHGFSASGDGGLPDRGTSP